jgi:hypothetical protein
MKLSVANAQRATPHEDVELSKCQNVKAIPRHFTEGIAAIRTSI